MGSPQRHASTQLWLLGTKQSSDSNSKWLDPRSDSSPPSNERSAYGSRTLLPPRKIGRLIHLHLQMQTFKVITPHTMANSGHLSKPPGSHGRMQWQSSQPPTAVAAAVKSALVHHHAPGRKTCIASYIRSSGEQCIEFRQLLSSFHCLQSQNKRHFSYLHAAMYTHQVHYTLFTCPMPPEQGVLPDRSGAWCPLVST